MTTHRPPKQRHARLTLRTEAIFYYKIIYRILTALLCVYALTGLSIGHIK